MYPGTHARQHPDKLAVVMAESGDGLTYAQLDRRSAQLAHYLRSRGLRPGDTVALLSPNDPLCFVVYWAAMRSGLYIAPLNHHLSPVEVASLLEHAEPRALILHTELSDVLEQSRGSLPEDCTVLVHGGAAVGASNLEVVLAGMPDHAPDDQPRGGEMLYSSGTTGGTPKGIRTPPADRQVHEPGDPMVATFAPHYEFDDTSVYLSPAPLYHGGPLRFAVLVQSVGGTVVVLRRFDAETALATIERWKCTHSQWVPTMFIKMLKLPDDVRNRYAVSTMRHAVHASAPCPVDVKHAMIDWWGPILDEYYASQEAAGITMISSKEWLERPGSVGQPVLGDIRICNDEGEVLRPGEVGTIYFARDTIPFTYHKAPELTRAAQHPKHPTWSTAGDIGRVDNDGYLYLTDRKAFMIICGGVNVYPQAIEDALALHPAVADAAAIGVPHDELGEVVKAVVVAAVEFEPSADLADELLAFLRTRLSGYNVPRSVDFVDSLPRTATGKLAKTQLIEQYRRGH